MLKLKSISPSRIKTFDMCRFKYYLTYHTDAVLKSNWGASHGSLIHDILENLSTGADPDWTARLYRGYGGVLDTLDRFQKPEIMESPLVWAKDPEFAEKKPYCDTCPYANKEANQCDISLDKLDNLTGCPKWLFDGSISMLEETISRYEDVWDKMLRDDAGVPIGVEYGFRIPLDARPDVPIHGYMDLVIEEDPETIHVIDYKAGKHTQNYAECRKDIQSRMYSLACRKEFIEDVNGKGYNYKNVMLTFDYFRNRPIILAFTEDEDRATEQFVLDKIEEIESTKWINRIVRNNEEMDTKTGYGQVAFICKYLCDSAVCKSRWDGRFEA